MNKPQGLLVGLVRPFLEGKLAILLILLALSLGVLAVQLTPREEEPQIVVPLADVFVRAPGASAAEVEQLVATPLERLLWQIDGVEHVYSMSAPEMAVVTVRFYVGEDRERSMVKLHNKIMSHMDQAPPLVRGWVVKPVEIDDVPILMLTLHSARHDDHELRRVAEELMARLALVPDISRTTIHGGRPRQVRVRLDPERLAGHGVTPLMVAEALAAADASTLAGAYDQADRVRRVTSDSFLADANQVRDLVVGVYRGGPVHLADVAMVTDGPAEAVSYSRLGLGRVAAGDGPEPLPQPAVTIAIAKKKGTNAVTVSREVLERLEELKPLVLPAGVEVTVTRDNGQTAQTKSDELMQSLFFAVLTVVALLAFTLGWREALVVAVAVPLSFALALFVNYTFGYTINRVTMFALILSLGLVVDDPITNVDNIQRHIVMGRLRPKEATLAAVDEVLPPVIMSTLAIIVSFAPMFFITGMMGPYMAPMAANVPLTVTFSTLWALTVVPWLSYVLLKHRAPANAQEASQALSALEVTPLWIRRSYRAVLEPFLRRAWLRWFLGLVMLLLLVGSLALVVLRQVPLKMLPFDNKNELQLVVDHAEGTTLETTDRAVRALETYLAGVPEVVNFVSFVGDASPMDFNGLVRHYYLRSGGHLADIRVNLAPKAKRAQQSHEIALRLRPELEAIAQRHGVNLKIVETPPGPPVLATLVAEVGGPPGVDYAQLLDGARTLKGMLATEPLVVDIDDSSEADRLKTDFVVDKEKAALHGVSTRQIVSALAMALAGQDAATVHEPHERQPLAVNLRLGRADRSSLAGLGRVPVRAADGHLVPLAELGAWRERPVDQPVYHKDLKPVVFVYAEVAGRSPATTVLDMYSRLSDQPLPHGAVANWTGEGEWQITLRVFRDLGLAFGAALLGIYILLVIQTQSFFMPLIMLLAVPLTLLGILPGFWLLNLVGAAPVGVYPNPVFFTATSMIGMIALGGIVIRNSVVLIEFIQNSLDEGQSFREAILSSGAVRFRPIMLTAATTALGAWPITLDPIFSGLAWALIFGLVASTAFTMLVIPVTYYSLYRKRFAGPGPAGTAPAPEA